MIHPANRWSLAILLVLATATAVIAATEMGYRGANNEIIPITSANPLPVTQGASSTVTPPFVNGSGVATSATLGTGSALNVIVTNQTTSTPPFIKSGVATSAELNTAGSLNVNALSPAASATGNPLTAPLAVMNYLSDNSGFQRWFTAYVLGDGVNGQNTAAVGGWYWNGATWDRVVGSTTAGMKVTVANRFGPTGFLATDPVGVEIASHGVVIMGTANVAVTNAVTPTAAYVDAAGNASSAILSAENKVQTIDNTYMAVGMFDDGVMPDYVPVLATITWAADIASSCPKPFTFMLQNTGTNKIYMIKKSTGSVATFSCCYMAAGDSITVTVGTNTPKMGFTAGDAMTATMGCIPWK